MLEARNSLTGVQISKAINYAVITLEKCTFSKGVFLLIQTDRMVREIIHSTVYLLILLNNYILKFLYGLLSFFQIRTNFNVVLILDKLLNGFYIPSPSTQQTTTNNIVIKTIYLIHSYVQICLRFSL